MIKEIYNKALDVYWKAVNNGVTSKQVSLTKKGIIIEGRAFEKEKWNDKTLPKYIKDLFPYVYEIYEYAFSNCVFTTLDLPRVVGIIQCAFIGSILKELNAPNLEIVGSAVFSNSKIKELNLQKVKTIWNSAFQKSPIEKLNIPNVLNIEPFAFTNSKITELNLQHVEQIGMNAFWNAIITKINLPNVISIETGAFLKSRVIDLNLPKIQNLHSDAFYNSKLITLNAPNLVYLGEDALGNSLDSKVKKMLPKNVTNDYAFVTQYKIYKENDVFKLIDELYEYVKDIKGYKNNIKDIEMWESKENECNMIIRWLPKWDEDKTTCLTFKKHPTLSKIGDAFIKAIDKLNY